MMKDHRNILIIASSENDANLYYATHFIAPDSFVFVQSGRRTYVLTHDLEIDRARSEARVDRVISLSKLGRIYQKKYKKRASLVELVYRFVKSLGTRSFIVPENFPVQYLDPLRAKGLRLKFQAEPLFPERSIKTAPEIRWITKTVCATETAMATAIATIKKSSIRNRKLYLSGKILTSEKVRKLIHLKLTELGCIPTRTIVACGKQSASPHNEGSGPLYAHRPIVIDIFPKNAASCYFADLTRTVVRGRATPKLKRMYAAVREAQHIAFRMIRHGAEASEIHAAIGRRFSELGFTTGTRNGRTEGFFHGTGHGLGLEIHELPKISLGRQKLAAGNVVTVEPGLYYQDTGGIRLEDDIVVTQKGCRKLSHLPQCLEI